MKKNVENNIFFEVQKYYFVFESRLIFFFQMVIFTTLFRRCPTLWKSTLKLTALFWRCSVQRWKTQRCFNVVLRCKFQRCFNVDLTLCDITTSYQPKNNVEPTLKCLLGSVQSPESRVQRPESRVQLLRPESCNSGMPLEVHVLYFYK